MQLIQFENETGERRVGLVQGDTVDTLNTVLSTRQLALNAIAAGHGLQVETERLGTRGETHQLSTLLKSHRVLAPLDHEDPAHCLVSGTGLTHTGSAATRNSMHQQALTDDPAKLTDSMRIFQAGLAGGRPARGEIGVQPEWFYKGDGSIVVRPGGAFPAPSFGEDLGEEPEIAGLYVIGNDGRPWRLGYALGNELSDHVVERQNYLYLAHSKLRFCAFGPVMRTGELPAAIAGTSRIHRNGRVLWEKPFVSGEANMCHSLENLEYHHFKYAQFLRPGDIHIHFFGTATLSFADGIATRQGDVFEIEAADFGPALCNPVGPSSAVLEPGAIGAL